MDFAIIAAGTGTRLADEGVETPKPLVRVNGEPMVDRLVRVFSRAGAERVHIITNRHSESVLSHLRQMAATDGRIRLAVENTPSSMHSFHELSKGMGSGKFILTTVDTIFREEEFLDFVGAWRESRMDGMMGVTSYVDDEKPLYVATDTDRRITGFHDDTPQPFVSGGIYGLTDKAFGTLHRCVVDGLSRMRNFQRQLLVDGLRLEAYPFGTILDVDHCEDIAKADRFLQTGRTGRSGEAHSDT